MDKGMLSSVQFSRSVVSDSLQPHGLQHTRLPCPSPTPGACLNLYPLSRWCHPTISSSVIPFFSCLQSFPVSESFLMSQFFPSGGQNIGASASVLPMSIQEWFPLELTGFISLLSKRLSRVYFCFRVFQLTKLRYGMTPIFIFQWKWRDCLTMIPACMIWWCVSLL